MSLKNIYKQFKPRLMLGITVAFASCSSKEEQFPSTNGAILNVGVKGNEEVVSKSQVMSSIKASRNNTESTPAQSIVSRVEVDALIKSRKGNIAATSQTSTTIQTAENTANSAYDENNLTLSFGGYRTKAYSVGGSSVSGSPARVLLVALAAGEYHY